MEPYKLTEEQLEQYIEALDVLENFRKISDIEKEYIIKTVLEHPYMDLRSDWAFKHVFQDMNLLKMLLEDVLPEDILSVEPLNELQALPNEIDKFRPDDKNIIMDVLVKTADGREIIVEMQRRNKDSFKKRLFYYGASMVHGQLKRKEPYSKLRPVYVMCFMDFKLKHETDQLLYHYTLREVNSGERYGNNLSIFLFELKRFNKEKMEGLSPLESWLFILKNLGKFAGKPEDMGARYSAVAEAAKLHDLPEKDKIQYLQDMISEEELMDIRKATLEEGREEGREEGKKEGRKEQCELDAKGMLQHGIAISVISEITGLSKEEITGL
jgi:predicted transposase/invertase (TIGR01784 family)